MKNLIFYKDKGEKFSYRLTIEGVSIGDTSSRLCLEFENGENVYFKGKINRDGTCTVQIPPLKLYEGKGIAKVECIAENTFFNLHSIPFEVKQKVNVKLDIEENIQEQVEETYKPKIQFELISENDSDTHQDDEKLIEELLEKVDNKEFKKPTKDAVELETFSTWIK